MSVKKPVLAIPLRSIKTPGVVGTLHYLRFDLTMGQKRFRNRYALVPDVDLRAFQTSAVIDWLTVEVKLKRSTQLQWIQKEVDHFLDRVPLVQE